MCRPAGLHVFPREKMTADMIVASACLPHLFRAVEIDGVPYWDGGYVGNPAIFRSSALRRLKMCCWSRSIRWSASMFRSRRTKLSTRINEITFNSSLIVGIRAIDFVARLIDEGKLPRGIGEGNTGASTSTASARPARRKRSMRPADLLPTMISLKCCATMAGARRAGFSTRTMTTLACDHGRFRGRARDRMGVIQLAL